MSFVDQQNVFADSCVFTLGFDAWEPYQYQDVGDKVSGLDIEIVEAVANTMGCTLEFKLGTWVSLLNGLKEGEVDILLGASKTEAREEFAYFSDAYRQETFSLYIRKNDANLATYTSFDEFIQNGHKIGIIEDFYYGPEVAELLEDPDKSKYFVNAIMGELNVARLLDGDIDVYIEDSFVGASMIRRKGLSYLITEQGMTITTGDAFVMFSKASVTEQQLELFNTELAKLMQRPHYQAIFDKYDY
ncbi:substrate-binding periplasmic protein [Paraglaciecola aestuariivivens]